MDSEGLVRERRSGGRDQPRRGAPYSPACANAYIAKHHTRGLYMVRARAGDNEDVGLWMKSSDVRAHDERRGTRAKTSIFFLTTTNLRHHEHHQGHRKQRCRHARAHRSAAHLAGGRQDPGRTRESRSRREQREPWPHIARSNGPVRPTRRGRLCDGNRCRRPSHLCSRRQCPSNVSRREPQGASPAPSPHSAEESLVVHLPASGKSP